MGPAGVGVEPRPERHVASQRRGRSANLSRRRPFNDQAPQVDLLPLATLAAVLVVLVILFDWNWLKGLVEDQASAALGREVEIAGDLDVDMGLRPRITIEDARLANAPWASDAPMVAVARAEAVIDLPALLRGRLELPEVVVVGPAVRLETRPDGPPNWEMKPGEPSQRPPTIPQIGRLQLRDGSIAYRDHGSGRTIAATLAELSGSTVGGTAIAATGEVEGEPVTLEVKAAPVQGGERPQVAYRIDARDRGRADPDHRVRRHRPARAPAGRSTSSSKLAAPMRPSSCDSSASTFPSCRGFRHRAG